MKLRFAGAWCGLLLAISAVPALSAAAQETLDQFNAANSEDRRHTDAENRQRIQELHLRNDRANALLGCGGIGAASSASACATNVEIDSRQRVFQLQDRALQEDQSHRTILQGLGVHRQP